MNKLQGKVRCAAKSIDNDFLLIKSDKSGEDSSDGQKCIVVNIANGIAAVSKFEHAAQPLSFIHFEEQFGKDQAEVPTDYVLRYLGTKQAEGILKYLGL